MENGHCPSPRLTVVSCSNQDSAQDNRQRHQWDIIENLEIDAHK